MQKQEHALSKLATGDESALAGGLVNAFPRPVNCNHRPWEPSLLQESVGNIRGSQKAKKVAKQESQLTSSLAKATEKLERERAAINCTNHCPLPQAQLEKRLAVAKKREAKELKDFEKQQARPKRKGSGKPN